MDNGIETKRTDGVCDSSHGTGRVELAIRESGISWVFGGVRKLELAAGPVESAELDRYLMNVSRQILEEAGVLSTQAPMPMRGVRVP